MAFDPDEYLKEPFDPDAYLAGPKQASWGTAFKQKLAEAGNAADAAISLPAGALASVFSQEEGDKVFREMEARRKANLLGANPNQDELSTTQSVVGSIGTLPAQILGMAGGPAEKGMDLINRGEGLGKASAATYADAALNAAGLGPMKAAGTFLGRAAIGAGANMATGAGSDAFTQLLADKQSTKEAYDPYNVEKRLQEGLVGGVLQGALGERPKAKSKLGTIKEQQAAVEASKPLPEAVKPVDEPLVDLKPSLRKSKEAYEAAVKERQLAKDSAFTPEAEAQRALDEQQGLQQMGELKGALDSFDQLGQDQAATKRYTAAQELLNQRQAELELAVKRQASLDNNASLRQHQEAASMVSELHARYTEQLRQVEEAKRNATENARLAEESSKASQRQQMEIDDTQHVLPDSNEVIAPQYGAMQGTGRFDENGMPIRADLSMEAANLENPLQRNLWGDELPRKSAQESVRGITKAMDITPAGEMKNAQIEALGGSTKLPPLGSAARKALMRKQGGGLLIDWGSSKKEQASLENAADVADEALIPKNPNAAEVVKKALAEGKDGKFLTYVQSGATSTAMKTGSAAIKAAAEIVQNAGKRAELAIRNIVSPAETSLRKLSSKEITELADVFKDEMFSNRRFDADVLSSNLSVKQLEAYTNMREMFDKALDAQNAERVLKGMKPITASEAYMSSRWSGDFRRAVTDSKGRTVWYLASNSKMGLEKQTKALLSKFPDLTVDKTKDHTVKSGMNKTDLQSMYTTMLDILGRDDPAIERIKQAIEEQTVAEGESTLGQEKHFKNKSNVHGFIGDRPGMEGKSEAIAMFHEQLQYAKNALTWSEMQTAANDIKGIISDPDLKAQQPHNVNYIREYFKNAIGHGEAKAIRALSDDIRTGLGVSPKVFDEAIGNVKSFFILQKLAASVGFTLANVVQTTNVLPYLMDLRSQGYKGNPVTAMGVGLPTGMMMMASHYLKSVGGEYIDKLPNQFLKDAIRYAEANGVTSRSVYDESPLETGFSPIKRTVNVASKTMTIPETFVRSVAFMTYAQMLKDSGKYTDQSKLFQHAEELVNMSMVDYRNTEKPLAFTKGGTMGNFLNTLQTFPMSFYNQYGYMARQASSGNAIPLMTMVALQAAMGGAMAVPYAEDLYRLFNMVKNNVVSDATWKKMQESPFLSDPKLWLMETLGKGSVYGYVSDKTGLGLSSRISAPAMSEMFQSPIGPAVDIAGQVGALGKAVMDPTNSTKWAQSAMKSVPVGLAGLLESSDMMKDHTYTTRPDGSRVYVKNTDLAARVATIKRSPEEDAVRRFGLRSQREVVEKDVQYITGQQNKAVKERIGGASGGAGELMEKFYDATRRGDKETAQRLATLYTQLSGKAINEEMVKRQVIQERMTALERTKKGMDKLGPQELINNARMLSILQDNK